MTKVEVFHCAVCEAFVSSSASSVRSHVTSQDHLANIKVGVSTQHTSVRLPFVPVDPLIPILTS